MLAGNLLSRALRLIPPQSAQWFQATRALNNVGIWVPSYSAPITVSGSFQPVPQRQFQNMGLDLNREYLMIYTSTNLGVLDRDTSGDKIVFAGDSYQVMSKTDWQAIDGWNGVLTVKFVAQAS